LAQVNVGLSLNDAQCTAHGTFDKHVVTAEEPAIISVGVSYARGEVSIDPAASIEPLESNEPIGCAIS
jgi:hypothetical protein